MLDALKKCKLFRQAPDFWWNGSLNVWAFLLLPISFIYGRIAGQRMLSKSEAVSKIPIVCVGNFVVGGTGKTPFAITLFNLLKERGYSPVFMLRGYGGNLEKIEFARIGTHSSREVGDEALLLSKIGPTIVGSDRIKGLETAVEYGHDIIIMDDGFQNPVLEKDVSIVLVDSEVGVGNGRCLPAGPLRAPLNMQIRKTDFLVTVGEGNAAEPVIRKAARRGLMPYSAYLDPVNVAMQIRKPVLAYSGIGRPQKFFDTAKKMGYELIHEFPFPDHHELSETEMERLLRIADKENLTLLTTSKDKSRLSGLTSDNAKHLKNRSRVLEVAMRIDRSEFLLDQIQELLARKRKPSQKNSCESRITNP